MTKCGTATEKAARKRKKSRETIRIYQDPGLAYVHFKERYQTGKA